MRKLLSLIVLISSVTLAQVPQGISHRGTVYDTSGTLITNTDVRIKISILDNNTTLVYSEIFYPIHTNLFGQYSLNIGAGTQTYPTTPATGFFSSIKWDIPSKFLKVEIDPIGGTTYSVSGSNQLMSVPYALFAEKINATNENAPIITVNSIADLRASNFHAEDITVVYVKYHTVLKDQGGGFFYWISDVPDNADYTDDDGIIINPTGHTGAGRWLRKMDGYIDVRYFGCMGFSQATDGQKIQKAIDFAAKNIEGNLNSKGNVVYLKNGSYLCEHLVMRSGVILLGESRNNTIIKLKQGSSHDFLVDIDSGPVDSITIENLSFTSLETNVSNVKGCFNFKGHPGSNGIGGLWNSTLRNIRILDFSGNSINLEGGEESSTDILPNQFNTFENVEAEGVGHLRQTPGNSFTYPPVLKMTGLNAQQVFTNCRFDGGKYLFDGPASNPTYDINGINVFIGCIDGGKYFPADITFNGCTFQAGEIGFLIRFGESIHILNSWFESFERAIIIGGEVCDGSVVEGCLKSKNINIQNNHFLYSAGRFGYSTIPADSGRIIIIENAQANIQNNYVVDPAQEEDTYFVSSEQSDLVGVVLANNYFDPPKLGKTYGVFQKRNLSTIAYDGGSIQGIATQANKIVFIENSKSSTIGDVYRIESSINTGETIFIRAEVGGLIFHPFNTTTGTPGRNVYLNGRTSLTLSQGQAATFIKLDTIVAGNEHAIYQLVSISD